MFVHSGFLSLLINCVCLLQLGAIVERIVGRAAFGAVYVATGILASAVNLAMNPVTVTAGASGAVLGLHGNRAIDWYGDSDVTLWAVLVAAGWKHTGYIMLLYLAGLKGVDPSLREAAAMDGASATKTFFRVVFPVMKPINIIVVVVTVIESLRAFDLVWVINKGRNGLELIGALVFSNIVGEGQRIGFGSALATIMLIISLVFIVIYLPAVMREDK